MYFQHEMQSDTKAYMTKLIPEVKFMLFNIHVCAILYLAIFIRISTSFFVDIYFIVYRDCMSTRRSHEAEILLLHRAQMLREQ